MADGGPDTGGSCDLRLDPSRCLRMRFSESSCSHCVAVCPHGAVTVEGVLAVNSQKCRGCLLCTSVCPSGALEPHDDFSITMNRLASAPEPLLGCIRTKESSHATLSCLGGLSEEHLLAIIHTLSATVAINISLCANCCNRAVISRLKQRLTALAQAGLSQGSSIVLAETALKVLVYDKSVDRRSFFKLFRSSLMRSAATALSTVSEQPKINAAYGMKRLPARRDMLYRTRALLSPELAEMATNHFDFHITVNGNCTACQGCVAICPTGALRTTSSSEPPAFDRLRCTGCGLCLEFCFDKALEIRSF